MATAAGVVEVIGDDGGVVTRLADGSYFGGGYPKARER